MGPNRDKLQAPLRKLSKSLKKVAKDISPQQTHNLRTRIRRSETVVHALMLDGTWEGKRLLKAVKPLYKKAGKVRDMDVMTTFAATLSQDGEEECLARLLEKLVSSRARSARKLRRAVTRERSKARRSLQQCGARMEREFSAPGSHFQNDNQKSPDTNPLAVRLATTLAAWPRLNAKNLHPYRRKVKELRYSLTLVGDTDDVLSGALRDVKDAIGAWHDWSELAAISSKVLDHRPQCNLRKQIRSNEKAHLEQALSMAIALQKKYFKRTNAIHRAR